VRCGRKGSSCGGKLKSAETGKQQICRAQKQKQHVKKGYGGTGENIHGPKIDPRGGGDEYLSHSIMHPGKRDKGGG